MHTNNDLRSNVKVTVNILLENHFQPKTLLFIVRYGRIFALLFVTTRKCVNVACGSRCHEPVNYKSPLAHNITVYI